MDKNNKAMKYYQILLIILISPFFLLGQRKSNKVKDSQAKGALFFYWGYNRSFYTNSKISFFGQGYNFSLAGVQATDRPSPEFRTYVNPTTLTVPQFNARIGYNFKKKWAVSFGYDHLKYVIVSGPTYLLTGQINAGVDETTNWSGIYNAEPVTFEDTIFNYENTNGMNYLRVELSHIDKLVRGNNAFSLSTITSIGAGTILNYNDFTFAGEKSMTTLSMSGIGVSAHIGLRFEFFKHFFLQLNNSLGFIYQRHVKIRGNDPYAYARQSLGYYQADVVLGGILYLRSKKGCDSCPNW
jgi:hypothetical protein